MMCRLKQAVAGIAGAGVLAGMVIVGVLLAGTVQAKAQGKIGAAPPVTYKNKYELYGGLNVMNFMAGDGLPKRMVLGGGELQGTYWLTKHVGLSADYRGEAGTTPVLPNPYNINRPLVYMNMGLLGAQYRGPKNQYGAVNFHGFFGAAHGVFDSSTGQVAAQYANLGMYSNSTKPIAAIGGSIDLNRSKRWAIRMSPDLILERFGTGTREFFALSGGVVYRFGKN